MADDLDFSVQRTVTGEELLRSSGRLERLGWLTKRISAGNFYFLQDGTFSQLLFQETADSFVNGQFIAAIVLGFSFIERSIAGRLSHVGGKQIAHESSEKLFRAALTKGWLTQPEYESLESLRTLRNPIIHFKEQLHLDRPEIRALLQGKTPLLMLEADARKILEAAVRLLGKTAI